MHRVAILALAIALVAVPVAQAQDPTPPEVGLEMQGWTSPLAPAEPQAITLAITYNCAKVPPEGGVKAWVNRSGPWWALTTGPQTVNLTADPVGCTQNQSVATRAIDYTLTLHSSAPAITPETVTWNVTITYPEGDQENETSHDVAAEFVPEIAVTVDPKRSQVLDGRTARHNVTVTNLGNGPIQAAIEIREIPRQLQAEVPGPATIEAAVNGSRPSWTGEIAATGTLPPDVNFKNFTASFALTTNHAENVSLAGTGRDLEMTVFVRRSDEEIERRQGLPGFGAPAALAALALALWSVRRRKLL